MVVLLFGCPRVWAQTQSFLHSASLKLFLFAEATAAPSCLLLVHAVPNSEAPVVVVFICAVLHLLGRAVSLGRHVITATL